MALIPLNRALPRVIIVLAGLALAGVACYGPVPAYAQSITLDQAKQSGLVGERPDGLVASVGPASAETARLITRVNAERLDRYRAIAQNNGTAVEAVQAVAGAKLITQAPAGTWVMDSQGSWHRK